jgi:beta-glucanase (GH16 family)
MMHSTMNFWPRLGALLALAGLAACSTSAPQVPQVPKAPQVPAARLAVPDGYRLVWADEFDRPGLPDPAKWVHDTGRNKEGWHNHELQYYAGPRLQSADVVDGRLRIHIRQETLRDQPDWGGQHYTSSRLITRGKAEWTYGFFEVRAKLPCGLGTWPAIWMLGTGGRWPEDGEIDILEQVGSRPAHVWSTLHMGAGFGAHGVGAGQDLADVCTAFHNYQMLWTADEMRFAVDGVVHHVYPKRKNAANAFGWWPFDQPQYLILNVAIGGDLGGPVDDSIFPRAMEVAHVRVYQPGGR